VADRYYVDVSRIVRIRAAVRRGLTVRSGGPFNPVFNAWGERYLAQARQQYRANSGGGWTPLAPRTVAERTRLGFGPDRPILVRLGVLFRALTRGAPGNLFLRIPGGIRVGFGGAARHPGYAGRPGRIPIAAIGRIHDAGGGNNPRRQIINPPTLRTRLALHTELRYGMTALIRSLGG
jgi:hypothetical protein